MNDEIITNSNENTHWPGTGPEKTRFEKAALVVPGWKKTGSNQTTFEVPGWEKPGSDKTAVRSTGPGRDQVQRWTV